jgi:flagellar hook-basal body complex protein FliE
MPIPAIQALGAVQQSGYADAASLMQSVGADAVGGPGALDATGRGGATSASGATFGASMAGAVEGLQQMQGEAKTLAVKAVTGDITDIHDATIAATRAQVTLELVSAVRNKGVDAFNEIMRMQA